MNEYDSELLESVLAGDGYLMVSAPEQADLIVVNTCSVRQKAEERAMIRINELASLKKTRPEIKLVVAGCMARRVGEGIRTKIPAIDYVIGPDHIPDIPSIVAEDGSQRILIGDKFADEQAPASIRNTGPATYVAISRGCENFCSYCIVPFVRGPFRSRPYKNIVDHVRRLAESGIKDITLLGQNVNSYCDGMVDFPALLKLLEQVAPPRLRFLTSHPKDFSDDLLDCFAGIPRLCHSLHLPLQSGSDTVLNMMNRNYTIDHYRGLIDKLRKAAPDITLTTDLIVGFPGETEAYFQSTLQAVHEIGFDAAFMFRYSARPGTSAAALYDDVPEAEKIERLNRLIGLQQIISEKKNERWIGKSLEILIHGKSRREPVMPKGKTRGGQSVLVIDCPDLKIGQMIMGRISSTTAKTLFAAFEKAL